MQIFKLFIFIIEIPMICNTITKFLCIYLRTLNKLF
nr:MAG TPA: hypothetical protein [Caudoviricetes sp.]